MLFSLVEEIVNGASSHGEESAASEAVEETENENHPNVLSDGLWYTRFLSSQYHHLSDPVWVP
jgi:hypothetical protein